MIELAIMIEGQNGLTWPRWQRLAAAAEDLGFAGLFRSDHYTNANPPDKESLECWTSLTWLASHTKRIQFGPLVSPVSFRHPTLTARMASAIDDLSGGRLVLGVGAGWQEREHTNYGWDLLDPVSRFDRFEEGLQIITHLLQSDTPLDFEGRFYHTREAVSLPRPNRRGGPPILVGGNGSKRTPALAARYASEWNAVYLPPAQFKERSERLDRALVEAGRNHSDVRRSMMTGIVIGKDDADLAARVEARTQGKRSAEDLRRNGAVVGTADQVVDQLGALASAGVSRLMLQWLDLDDLDRLDWLAARVLPQLSG